MSMLPPTAAVTPTAHHTTLTHPPCPPPHTHTHTPYVQAGESIDEAELESSSCAMGYGAVKYADLRNSRLTNYKFSFDAMLDLKGNTAVYLLYAHARIAGIVRKSGRDIDTLLAEGKKVVLEHPKERELGVAICKVMTNPTLQGGRVRVECVWGERDWLWCGRVADPSLHIVSSSSLLEEVPYARICNPRPPAHPPFPPRAQPPCSQQINT